MPTDTFPIQELVSTIEGEGPRSGEPIVLIRFGLHEALRYLHVAPQPLKKTPAQYLNTDQIVQACEAAYPKLIHIGGEDPMLCRGFEDLVEQLLGTTGADVMIDTFGMVSLFEHCGASKIIWSVCPRPNLPLDDSVFDWASEFRLYLSTENLIWDELTNTVLDRIVNTGQKFRIAIMPREITDECILKVLRFCLTNSSEGLVAAIPLYQIFPRIDEVAISRLDV